MSRRLPSPPPGEPGYTGPPQVKPEPPPAPPPKRCCSGVNGSHTLLCNQTSDVLIETHVCWQCGKVVPRDFTMLWSALGCRCLCHEGDPIGPDLRAVVEYPTVEDVIASQPKAEP